MPPIMKFFKYDHLPVELQVVSRPFCELANYLVRELPQTAELYAGLRKLMEAKDCAVRAHLEKQIGEDGHGAPIGARKSHP